jgi:hypothetical protein
MQCFGYCLVERDAAVRDRALANDGAWRGRSYGGLPAAVDEVMT